MRRTYVFRVEVSVDPALTHDDAPGLACYSLQRFWWWGQLEP